MIGIETAPPYCTVQDRGRPRTRHAGVPTGGAMDPHALTLVDLLVGNRPEEAALEWALGPGILHFGQPLLIAASEAVRLEGVLVPAWTSAAVRAGDRLDLPPPGNRFGYLAIQGGVAVPSVLGSQSTYLPARFGGWQGRMLQSGDRLPCGAPPESRFSHVGFTLPEVLWHRPARPFRFVPGPDLTPGDPGVADLFAARAWSLSRTGDRMGYRLEGDPLPAGTDGSQPSAPVAVGSIQLPGSGVPIVLMPDGPTVGGYPQIGVVITVDLGRLAQSKPGTEVHFAPVTVEEAQSLLRRQRVDWHTAQSLIEASA